MISATRFTSALLDRGYEFFSGVPCSHLAGPVALLSRQPRRYVPAANEGAAMAMAAGARMAGIRSAVLIQNSGLGNLVNPLTSLVLPYEIPVLVMVSMRGHPVGTDEPQHAVMGRISESIVDSCGVPGMVLEPTFDSLVEALTMAEKAGPRGGPFFVFVPKGTIGQADPAPPPTYGELSRADVVRTIAAHADDAAIYSTTGYTSRELFAIADRAGNFYVQGSMGHALALGLGTALRQPERQVVVLDGDGAALMHMGTLSTVGHLAPANLLHVVLDNGTYGSTGSQPTTSATVDWPAVARATGYRQAWLCTDQPAIETALRCAAATPGPSLIAVRIRADETTPPPRASASMTLPAVRARFERELAT